jgi:pimeloyl-ACP methyl ester carboxylesterase
MQEQGHRFGKLILLGAIIMFKKHLEIFLSASLFLLPTASLAEQRLNIGKFNSRAIFREAPGAQCPAPLVILVPGSGANGPEEMIPAKMTGDGKDHSIFASFSEGLNRGRVSTLALGKPGVDFFKSWDPKDRFYDLPLFQNLAWQDLIDNLKQAIDFAKTLPCVDLNRIYVLGHSEGTQVAVDFALQNPLTAKGLILVGFDGESLATTVDWQIFRRVIDVFVKPDVDTNQDGFMSKSEAAAWPELVWQWEPSQDKVSLTEMERKLRESPALQKEFQKLENAKIWQGVFHRSPVYDQAARLKENLYVFTGALDVQTRPEYALEMKDRAEKADKKNCEVFLVPGLGHAMSAPKGIRKQPLLDATLGPVDESFKTLLQSTAAKF